MEKPHTVQPHESVRNRQSIKYELNCPFLLHSLLLFISLPHSHRCFTVRSKFLVNSRDSTLAQLLLLVLLVLTVNQMQMSLPPIYRLMCPFFMQSIVSLSLSLLMGLTSSLARFKGSSFPFLSLFLPPLFLLRRSLPNR